MADQAQLERALRRAHAAGDVEGARRLARAIKAAQTAATPAPQPVARSADDPSLWAGGAVPSVNPTDGMSGTQRFGAGAGKSVMDTARGIGQLFGAGPTPEEVDQQRRLDAPLMSTGAGMLGNIAGQTAQIAVPLGGGARLASVAGRAAPYLGAAGRGAAFAATQPVATDESRAGNAALGGALGVAGQGIASGAGKLAQGVASRLDAPTQALVQRAQQAGLRLGVGELSQNPAVRTIISQMERLPFSGARARATANQEAFNEVVGGTFGAQGRKITPDVFAKAKAELGRQFDDLTARNDLTPTTQLVSQIQQIVADARRMGTSDTARMVTGHVNELLSKVGPNGSIPGSAYRQFDTALGQKLKSGGDPAHYLGQLREAIRNAMDQSISPADQAAWRAARQGWASLKQVEPLVAKAKTGDIPAAQLMGRVTADKAGKARMAAGNGGTLGELARIGQFLKEAPNSGTADRLLVNGLVAGGAFGAQHVGLISPEKATGLALLLGGNRAALKALSSKGVVHGNSPALRGLARLLKPAPRLLPAAGVSSAAAAEPAFDIGTVDGYDPRYGR